MADAGLFYALDLATRTGFAKGRPGERPFSGAILLKRTGQPRAVALGNLIAFLNDEWSIETPKLVCTEAPLSLGAFATIGSSEANVRMHHGLHGVVEGMCGRFGCRLIEANNAKVRKHFIGVGNMGDRDATKLAVVRRCHMLGLMPKDSNDNDRADAIALHDWSCATFGRRSTSIQELVLFESKGKAHGA
jgi:hypothetical protein